MNEAPEVGALPDHVRERVVAYAATVLPDVPALPPALRRVASFAPARRGRLGAAAITAALADDELRARIGVQLRSRAVAGETPAEEAAYAWLVRDDDWRQRYDAALAALQADAGALGRPAADRLQARVERLEQELASVRADRRARLEELRAENAVLRHKLGDLRATVRQTSAGHHEALAKAEAAREEAEAQVGVHERTLRQLRAQIDRLEAAAAAARRTSKAADQEASLRARFLLDALLDAASGLRRELALPAVDGSPAAQVEAGLTAGAEQRHGAVRSASHLQQFLSMPRARLIVDGYNVSKSLWPSSTLEAQRSRLLQAVAPLVARTGAETTVVFDAAATGARLVVPAPRGVKVVFSPEGVIADDVIRDLVRAEPTGRVVLVVSDDQQVARDITAAGARSVPVGVLQGVIERV